MEYLTEKHISEITTLIRAKGVEMEELLYDLVDHVCCMIEEKMEQGKNYASALDETMNSFGNKGIRNIQEETTYLLTKNILVMRKTMHIIGITSALLLLLGSIFKIQHWPGAGVIAVGAAFIFLIFLLLYLVVRLKEKVGKLNNWTNIIGVVGGIALSFGIVFKVMHWPMANILMNTGGFILLFIFLPLYIYSSYKNKQLKTSTLVPVIISIAGFSLMFSLVKLRNSHTVTSAILNIQYTINSDVEAVNKTNQALLIDLKQDSISIDELTKADEIASSINGLISNLNFEIAKSQHPEISDEKIKEILTSNYGVISNAKVELSVLRNQEKGLLELLSLIDAYQNSYKQLTGVEANVFYNKTNIDYYLNSKDVFFPLGIIINDLSIVNLQIQKTHTALLQNFKGRVS